MEDTSLSYYGGAEVILIPIVELIALFIFCLYLLWGYADKKRSNHFI